MKTLMEYTVHFKKQVLLTTMDQLFDIYLPISNVINRFSVEIYL